MDLNILDTEEKIKIADFTNADYIFFFYNFLNHVLYHKVMGMINSNFQIKWDYISSKNLDLVEKDIYEKISKMSK